MAKNNKPLLNEGTVRRMMKLANMEALGDNFISEKKYEWHKGDDSKSHPGDHDEGETSGDTGAHGDTDYAGHGMRDGDESDTGPGEDFVKEEEEFESELDATEDELGAEDEVADEEAAELEGEVTITDDEAQDIIDLADKLKGAVGDSGEEEVPMDMGMDIDAEEEIDIEDPGVRGMYEEELYEAALKGLNIDLVDDKAIKRKALVQETRKRIYERVVRRLIAANKK
tara:strand:- start:453 stop:1133 length:681 start_codon:yes stop_codon:yes gene_type:complete